MMRKRESFRQMMRQIKQENRLLHVKKKIWKLQDKKWVVMTKGFCIGMKLKLYLLLSIGIRSLIRQRIDEKLSDTGLREV